MHLLHLLLLLDYLLNLLISHCLNCRPFRCLLLLGRLPGLTHADLKWTLSSFLHLLILRLLYRRLILIILRAFLGCITCLAFPRTPLLFPPNEAYPAILADASELFLAPLRLLLHDKRLLLEHDHHAVAVIDGLSLVWILLLGFEVGPELAGGEGLLMVTLVL